MAAILAANRQSGGEDGCYREKFRNFVAWAEPDPKTAPHGAIEMCYYYYYYYYYLQNDALV